MKGMPGRDELLARYAEVSGRQLDDLDYYLVLSRFKMGVVIEQGFQRAGDNTTLQAFGPIAVDLMSRAASLAESTGYQK
jgi:aminoglycoside phosphotransferase (APT) family kinase protein